MNPLRAWREYRQRRKRHRIERWLADYHTAISAPDARARFDAIYRGRLWSRIGQTTETESGAGSTLKASRDFRRELARHLATMPPGLLFDAPCGDFHFMRNVDLPVGWRYRGADIAPTLVADLRRRHPSIDFIEFDITSDRFPDASIWLCRACLCHLSYADVRKALANFARSNVDIALITTHIEVGENRDIVTGDYRPLDLTLPPIGLPKPKISFKDVSNEAPPQTVAVWTRHEIAVAAASWLSVPPNLLTPTAP